MRILTANDQNDDVRNTLDYQILTLEMHFLLETIQEIVCNERMSENNKYEIDISIRTTYLPDQSSEDEERHVFAYTITIENNGLVATQLISRHWIIDSGDGSIQEVRGLGVVGEQPLLRPGDSFEYTSGTVISSSVGSMKGSYQMAAEDGVHFDVSIPEFILSVPRVIH